MIFNHNIFTKLVSGILFVTLFISNIPSATSTDIYVAYGDDGDSPDGDYPEGSDYYGGNGDSSSDDGEYNFRSGINYLVQHGGGNLYVNYTENPIELYFGPITIYPENIINISKTLLAT